MTFDDRITILRPVAEVFVFYRDFRNLPRFLGDVVAIEPDGENRSRWTIEGPLGMKVHWTAVVTEVVENQRISYETTSDVLRTRWDIHFSPGPAPGQTIVREVMHAPGGEAVEAGLWLMGKKPGAELHSNLHRLKQLLETGSVTDTANSVRGKFGDR